MQEAVTRDEVRSAVIAQKRLPPSWERMCFRLRREVAMFLLRARGPAINEIDKNLLGRARG